jgi:hypothetical protein
MRQSPDLSATKTEVFCMVDEMEKKSKLDAEIKVYFTPEEIRQATRLLRSKETLSPYSNTSISKCPKYH